MVSNSINNAKPPSQTKVFFRFLKKYLNDYGGWRSILRSPLFIFSVILSLASYKTWLKTDWPETALSVIPNLLGFSLGTYALLFSLISPRIRLALKTLKNRNGVSYLDELNATFLHFILVQIICFLWSYLYIQTLFSDLAIIISEIYPSNFDVFPYLSLFGSYIGVLLLLYSVLLVLGSSMAVYRIARIHDPGAM